MKPGDTVLFTIGHSSHTLDTFLKLLRSHEVTTVADVRSLPGSRLYPYFAGRPLAAALDTVGVEYVFFGDRLGGRPRDPSCYIDGRVSYDRVALTSPFKEGLEALMEWVVPKKKVALMCAEEDPLRCHRTILVVRQLVSGGYLQKSAVLHIRGNGELESHDDAVERLVAETGCRQAELPLEEGGRPEDPVDCAFRLRAEEIAYVYPERQSGSTALVTAS